MEQSETKGHVEFKQPKAKLVADIPGDEEMREQIEEWQANDGYPDSCGIQSGDSKALK